MNNLIIYQSRLIEATVVNTTVGQQLAFTVPQDIASANIIVYGIESYTSGTITTSPSGGPVVTDAGARSLTVIFADKNNKQLIQNMPVQAFNRAANDGFYTLVGDMAIDLTKSVVVVNSAAGLTGNDRVLFNIYYK